MKIDMNVDTVSGPLAPGDGVFSWMGEHSEEAKLVGKDNLEAIKKICEGKGPVFFRSLLIYSGQQGAVKIARWLIEEKKATLGDKVGIRHGRNMMLNVVYGKDRNMSFCYKHHHITDGWEVLALFAEKFPQQARLGTGGSLLHELIGEYKWTWMQDPTLFVPTSKRMENMCALIKVLSKHVRKGVDTNSNEDSVAYKNGEEVDTPLMYAISIHAPISVLQALADSGARIDFCFWPHGAVGVGGVAEGDFMFRVREPLTALDEAAKVNDLSVFKWLWGAQKANPRCGYPLHMSCCMGRRKDRRGIEPAGPGYGGIDVFAFITDPANKFPFDVNALDDGNCTPLVAETGPLRQRESQNGSILPPEMRQKRTALDYIVSQDRSLDSLRILCRLVQLGAHSANRQAFMLACLGDNSSSSTRNDLYYPFDLDVDGEYYAEREEPAVFEMIRNAAKANPPKSALAVVSELLFGTAQPSGAAAEITAPRIPHTDADLKHILFGRAYENESGEQRRDHQIFLVLLTCCKGFDPNESCHAEGTTPLNAAMDNGMHLVVEALLRMGADPNLPDRIVTYPQGPHMKAGTIIETGGSLPIVAAATGNGSHEEESFCKTLELLIDAGANVNAVQSKPSSRSADEPIKTTTALHAAARNGRVATIRILLAAGADRSIRNNKGKTAFDVASSGARALLKPQ